MVCERGKALSQLVHRWRRNNGEEKSGSKQSAREMAVS
jgi:hypothetical protein